MPNRLAGETSPYLLQHADNPVDWQPWDELALEQANKEDRPIFLSIGYSACHWCHVMAHESFEDDEIAATLNKHFVAIKVDREERPDLDRVYMNSVQMMTGRGGWPMSVFLTPDLKPIYGGTYWPPHPRMGMPGFDQVIAAVADAWENRREQLVAQADEITRRLRQIEAHDGPTVALDEEQLHESVAEMSKTFDPTNGGFGGAPKFPHPMDLRLMLRTWSRRRADDIASGAVAPLVDDTLVDSKTMAMVRLSLDKMAAGGIYDHLGGGFHRYSVDERWLVPHFEKMLYDNALLSRCYLEAYQATGNEDWARVVRETLDYVIREMTAPDGGFYSTQDADSEGEEGKFFIWTPAEVADVLGEEAAETFCRVYDVSEAGNFEQRNILNLPKTIDQYAAMSGRDIQELRSELTQSRAKLFAVRSRRIAPSRDDKIIVAWNGLMIDSMAAASAVLGEARYYDVAANAAEFILERLRRDGDDRLLHSWCADEASGVAFVDDYACLTSALVTLYEASFDERWIDAAAALADEMLALFTDAEAGGFFYTAADETVVITRGKDVHDSATPSGNAMAATALVRLGKLTGRADFSEAGRRTLAAFSGTMKQFPTAMGQMQLALDLEVGPTYEVVLMAGADDGANAALAALRRQFIPRSVLASRRSGDSSRQSPHLEAIFRGKSAEDGESTAYVCQQFTCGRPVVGREAIMAEWQRLSGGGPGAAGP